MADVKNNEAGLTDVSPQELSTSENVSGKGNLLKAVGQALRRPDAVTVHYDTKKERVGDSRFIVVDSPDKATHIQINASVQGGGVNPIGFERHNYVNIMWWNESDGEMGQVQYTDRRDNKAFYSKVVSEKISEDHLEYLKENGGGDYLPGGGGVFPEASEDQLNDLAKMVGNGSSNKELTDALLKQRRNEWGAQKINDVRSNGLSYPDNPQISNKV